MWLPSFSSIPIATIDTLGAPLGTHPTLQGEAVGKSTNKGWFSWEKPSMNSSTSGERTSSLYSPS